MYSRATIGSHDANAGLTKDSQIFYRSLQLCHGEMIELAELVTPGAQLIAILILIVTPFSIIRFGRSFDGYTLGLLGILAGTTFILLFLIMLVFSNIREHSSKFPGAHRHVLDARFRKSCQPLRWKMGTYYYITRNSFLTLLKNLVIKALIRLILTFRRK